MKPTTITIAQELGLSRSTVSMALRDHPAIKAATKQRVHEAAQRLNYVPNDIARAMTEGRTRVVGVLCNSLGVQTNQRFFTQAAEQFEAADYFVKYLSCAWDLDVDTVANRCARQKLCAVIGLHVNESHLAALAEKLGAYGIPLAVVSRLFFDPRVLAIGSDDADGVKQIMDHLVYLGHRRIGCIAGAANSPACMNRLECYRQYMASNELPMHDQHAALGHYDPQQVTNQARVMLSNPTQRPTAIFCTNDTTALSVIGAARRLNLRVPEDLSVVGFSNLDFSDHMDPPLTTVKQPFEKVAVQMTRRILDVVDQQDGDFSKSNPGQQLLKPELVVRQSTAVVNQS
ncbi:MAG TPA: hypothetical protein DCM28_01215 [Phycisphaerales bacterium]|nr:hypothetical protein [Phycisphaerales bacterium]HCD31468.1 hypothetical protein [Phycisphaerales bacterium]|tara:strand:+ start:1329 stop:2360 length:1032 start_codon:yes stop_codon:yes gene_type:complete